MLLRALDLLDGTPMADQASQVFSTLSWKNSLSYRADRFQKGEGVVVLGEGKDRRVEASAEVAEVVYPLAVARGGDYRVRMLAGGGASLPAETEIRAVGDKAPHKTLSLPLSPEAGWADVGSVHLDPGAYTATVLLPKGGNLQFLEVAPPCLNPIEPMGGWKATATATTADVAVTALKAMDLEYELAPADSAIEVTAANIKAEGALALDASYGLEPGLEGIWLRAGASGLEASVVLDLPETGLYSVSVFGVTGGGQRWAADSCRKSVLCPEPASADGPRWRQVFSGEFGAGRHFFTVTLGRGAAIQRVRLERKRDAARDYLAALARLGLDLGPEGPVTRDKAVEAMRFIRDRKGVESQQFCRDVIDRDDSLIASEGLGQPTAPITPPGTPFGNTPLDPLAPVIPPQDVASPDEP
jgi:hypothetical protein